VSASVSTKLTKLLGLIRRIAIVLISEWMILSTSIKINVEMIRLIMIIIKFSLKKNLNEEQLKLVITHSGRNRKWNTDRLGIEHEKIQNRMDTHSGT
jgi:hypothetical protein